MYFVEKIMCWTDDDETRTSSDANLLLARSLVLLHQPHPFWLNSGTIVLPFKWHTERCLLGDTMRLGKIYTLIVASTSGP